MKKFIKLITFTVGIILSAITVVGLAACDEQYPEYPILNDLSQELKEQISLDYFDFYWSGAFATEEDVVKIKIYKYLGTYNGGVVIEMEDSVAIDHIDDPYDMIIDDVFICNMPGSHGLKIYFDNEDNDGKGAFYTLQSAYDNGLITKDDLQSVADNYKKIQDGAMQPFDGLDNDAVNKIRQSYFDIYCLDRFATWDDMHKGTVVKYLGTYNGYIAIEFVYSTGFLEASDKVIDDVHFYNLDSGVELLLYKSADSENKATFDNLVIAYSDGLISKNDLISIAHYANS